MRFTAFALMATALSVALPATQAHIGPGVPSKIQIRNTDMNTVRAVRRMEHSHDHHRPIHRRAKAAKDEASEAQIETPTEECKPYGLSAVNDMVKDFPTAWDVADILPHDTQAMAIMQAINASGLVPTDIQARGQQPASLMGTGTETGYNSNTDPACYWTATGCTTPKAKGVLPDIISCAEPHTWGYTLDDGPNCTHNALYDFWKTQNQKVSLMYIGSNVMDWPLQAQRGLADGHHICVHTWSHKYMTALTSNQAFAELYYTMQAIKKIMGITPTCWRPPYGDVDDRIRAIAQSLGLRTYVWDHDTDDWEVAPEGPKPTATVQANYDSIISLGSAPAAETGGIVVLQHELTNGTMELVKENYPKMKSAFPNIVPLTACLNLTHPYVEDIIYPNFAEYVGGNVMPSGLPTTFTVQADAVATPQGTLKSMGSLMATAPAGGPDNAGVVSSSSAAAGPSSSNGSPDNLSNKKSAASPSTVIAPFAVVIAGLTAGAFMLLNNN
ncbi:glycoside hydrolase/deacetylase [Meira miltonrushii]|uniref:chitin deacetylase n=1 Tax=Meira miltonrushii TaxID=1280837 RepID=A0A316VB80_9BASI|nr:glycoside hydrolase/deacetylase [Meira miltonrushii]PWN34524.1 glycoside hydrolase/deacetylase [Meira miltonrushii]